MEDSTAADIKKLAETLPEDERKGNIGKIFSYLIDVMQSGWNIKDAVTNVNKSHAFVLNLKDIEGIFQQFPDGEEAILAVMKYQKKNCPEAMNNERYNRLGCTIEEMLEKASEGKIEDHDKTKMHILEALKNYREEESNEMIKNMVNGSAFVAAFQLVKIYMAWKEIEAASNLIEDPEKFTVIKNNLSRMTNLVQEFLSFCETNPNDTSTITRKTIVINNLFNKTRSKISDLRVKIDGHIQRLDLLADHKAVDAAVNFVTAGTQGFQVWYSWDELISWAKVLGLASVALFTGLGLANCKFFLLTQEKLKHLRKDLREATRLQEMLDDLYEEATQAFEDMHATTD